MKLYGLIGYPLGHSFSKQYFMEKFEREGLNDCHFEAFPITSINEFPILLQQNKELKGLSVTIPYKEQVLPFITELSDEVKFIGATNSIKILGERLIAYNTDIVGFEETFSPLLKSNHTKALILGTGGASKAIQFVLKKMNIDFLLVTRSPQERSGYIHYSSIDKDLMDEYNIIINCSPVGTSPNDNVCPEIQYQFLSSRHYLYDLVYKPSKTLFLQKGELAGARIKNGKDMLIIQAEASWKLWNS